MIVSSLVGVGPLLILVWMIGFSGDRLGLRTGGFIVLAIKWLLPVLIYGLAAGGAASALRGYASNALLGAVLLGGYMIFWAIRSRARMVARLALAAGGLVALGPLLMILAATLLTYRSSV